MITMSNKRNVLVVNLPNPFVLVAKKPMSAKIPIVDNIAMIRQLQLVSIFLPFPYGTTIWVVSLGAAWPASLAAMM